MPTPAVADIVAPVFESLMGKQLAVRIDFWDGSSLGDPNAPGTITFKRAEAFRRIIWAPGELGVARAYVSGDIDINGDGFATLDTLVGRRADLSLVGTRTLLHSLAGLRHLGGLKPPPAAPVEEARQHGRRHSKRRDVEAIAHHYDLSNDFYRLVLGPSFAYSCARFPQSDTSLEEAQRNKYDLRCRKLGLKEGMRLLDVGCGWGSMVIHAAEHYGVSALGITLSREQFQLAQKRADDAGVGARVELRVQDYRELDEHFDAISSIGMFEHVGRKQMSEYFSSLALSLEPGGRLLNHAIDSVGGSSMGERGFVGRYVFPDGELQDISTSIAAMQDAGLEVRDVESLREHYAKTLKHWLANLDRHWDEAVSLVGEQRARVWRIYMTGSAVSFEKNRISVHQSLAVKTASDGASNMALTRAEFV